MQLRVTDAAVSKERKKSSVVILMPKSDFNCQEWGHMGHLPRVGTHGLTAKSGGTWVNCQEWGHMGQLPRVGAHGCQEWGHMGQGV